MAKTSTIIVGTGGMVRHHMNVMLTMSNTSLYGLVEVAEEQRQLTRDLFGTHDKQCPPFYGTARSAACSTTPRSIPWPTKSPFSPPSPPPASAPGSGFDGCCEIRPRKIVAALTEPTSILSYLEGVGLSARPPPIAPARPALQPELEFAA